ncbi:MAG TPA: ribonuclease III [Candidatus Paceibacterota bacterium]
MPDFTEFEKTIGITFVNKELLKQAFLHRSYLNENRSVNIEHNERIEFLGDAVLELVVTDFLFHRFPKQTEGDLTAYRSALVNTTTLSAVASSLNMGNYLLLSKGEARDMGRARQYILANTYEALVGALYLDQGYEGVRGFIERTVLPLIDEIIEKRLWQDHKSLFQEKAQEKANTTPSYKTLREEGPDHGRHFIVGVFLGEEQIASGEGMSKQEAEQNAAEKALSVKNW